MFSRRVSLLLAPHLLSGLVLPQPDINRLPQQIVGGPGQIGDLGDKLRLDPITPTKQAVIESALNGAAERLTTTSELRRVPRRTSHDGIPLPATMFLDNAGTPFRVAPRLPWRWRRHYVDPALGGDREKAEA